MLAIIDRNSPIPLYYQLKNILLSKIHGNDWKAGELIPSEHELEAQYAVSRTTIRQTLNELVIEGYLVRQRGRGTFIAQPKVAYDPAKRLETNEYYHQHGMEFGWKLLGHEWITPPSSIAEALGISEKTDVYRLRRLRLNGNEIIGSHIAYVPRKTTPYINDVMFCEGESLSYLATHPMIKEASVERTLEATIADKTDMEWLKVGKNSPILQMHRLLRAKDNSVIEYLSARFVGDRFKYRFTT
jgi:GntR family transcriptional regulator